MFNFGRAVGQLEAATIATGARVSYVAPQVWKRALGVKADKDHARLRAAQLFPAHAAAFARKMDDGPAEAALIALYGMSQWAATNAT
jgi:crossover junction endodeoxyribonuclease RuvC